MTTEFNDGLESGSRRPRLYLVRGDDFVRFRGQGLPGYCCIASQRYVQNGKWSATTWGLELAPGVRSVRLLSPLHGVWGDDLSSWAGAANLLGLSLDSAKRLIGKEYSTTAKRFDNVEKFLAEIENQGVESELAILTFGSPTNRQISEGFWRSAKSTHASDGQLVTVVPSEGSWDKAVATAPLGATVIWVKQYPGHHGGSVSIQIAVPVSPAE